MPHATRIETGSKLEHGQTPCGSLPTDWYVLGVLLQARTSIIDISVGMCLERAPVQPR
jgi:hypothetical protein